MAQDWTAQNIDGSVIQYFTKVIPIRSHKGRVRTICAAFLPSGYKDFLRGIMSEEDFIFEVTDFNGSRAMASFKDADKGTEKRDFVLGGCKK